MSIESVLEGFAKIGLPLLGAALPIPGGAAIGTLLASKIGSASADPSDILTKLTESSDALEKAKEFELTHEETILKITTDAEVAKINADVADATSARSMQVSTKSYIVPTLAVLIVGSFLGTTASVLFGWGGAAVNTVLAGTLIGYLSAKCEQVVAFYFGSSHGSQAKDAVIAQQANTAASK